MRIRFRPDWRHPAVRKALALSGWTIGYVIANQVAAQIVNVLAEPGSGDVTQLQRRLHVLPAAPRAAGRVAHDHVPARPGPGRGRTATGRRSTSGCCSGCGCSSLVVVPAAIGYLVLALSLGGAAEASGELVDGATLPIARILAGFALGLIGFSVYLFVLRAFYALQDTRTPFFLNCAENALNIVLAVVLVRSFGVVGLAVAYAIAYSRLRGGRPRRADPTAIRASTCAGLVAVGWRRWCSPASSWLPR